MSSVPDEGSTAVAEAEPAAPVDEIRTEMLGILQRELGDSIVESALERGQLWVRVDPAAWRRAAEVVKVALDCDYFCFLAGLDWLANPDLPARNFWDPEAKSEAPAQGEGEPAGEADAPAPTGPETGIAGGGTRFQVFARFGSTRKHWAVVLKADLDDAQPSIETISGVYRGADWHEREAWEMYGFEFRGHSGLRHLYLPGGFEGFPLRKDFPLLAREVKPWPGLVDKEPMPGEGEDSGDGEGA